MDLQTLAKTKGVSKGIKLLAIAVLLLLLAVGVAAAYRSLNRNTTDAEGVNQKSSTSDPRDTREGKSSMGYGSNDVASDSKEIPHSDATATKKPEAADGKSTVLSTLPNRKPGGQPSRAADPVLPKRLTPAPRAESEPSIPKSPKSQSSNGQSSQSSSLPQSPVSTPQSPVDQANQLRRSMEARYGVKILYGTETDHYRPGGRITAPLTGDAIKEALQELDRVLGRYPAGFFREFSVHGVNLSFYLVAGITQGGSFAGFADAQFMNDLKITLLKLPLMSFTAHHEIMHAIDSFMELKMYPGNPYDEYTAINPAGFQYGVFNRALVWGYSENGAYFTTEYGQTNRREDKAEMFKFMTRESGSVSAIFARHPYLNVKARVIARQIDAVFQTAGPNEFWTRHLR